MSRLEVFLIVGVVSLMALVFSFGIFFDSSPVEREAELGIVKELVEEFREDDGLEPCK